MISAWMLQILRFFSITGYFILIVKDSRSSYISFINTIVIIVAIVCLWPVNNYYFIRYFSPSVWLFDDHSPLHTTVTRLSLAVGGYSDPEILGTHSVTIITDTAPSAMQDASQTPASAVPTTVPLKIGPWEKTTLLTTSLPSMPNGL